MAGVWSGDSNVGLLTLQADSPRSRDGGSRHCLPSPGRPALGRALHGRVEGLGEARHENLKLTITLLFQRSAPLKQERW